jgi:hypothetical protein
LYLGGGHLWELALGDLAWTHIWKGGGAVAGCYWFLALATAGRTKRTHEASRMASGDA